MRDGRGCVKQMQMEDKIVNCPRIEQMKAPTSRALSFILL